MRIEVGNIQGYPVIFIPEKNMVFCKNTVCRVSDLDYAIYKSSLCREKIEEKNLSIIKDGSSIYFGCLTTTIGNINSIKCEINKIKKINK